MKYVITILLILTIQSTFSQAKNLENWKVKQVDNVTVYTPNNLKAGEYYTITLFPNSKLNGTTHQNWVKQFVSNEETKLGQITWRGKQNANGNKIISTGRKFKNDTKKELTAVYLSPKLDTDIIGLMRIDYLNRQTYQRYQYALVAVTSIMEKQETKTTTAQTSRQPLKRIIKRPTINAGKLTVSIKELLFVGYQVVGMYGFKPTFKAVATFNDHTVSKDMNTIFSEGVMASKQKNPNDWGVWRMNGNKLEIKWKQSKSYKNMSFIEKLSSRSKNEKLDGCWSSKMGFSLPSGSGSSSSMSINVWCFNKNGRFSNDITVGISGNTGDYGSGEVIYTGNSKKDKTGWYRIDDRVIQLIYDNGKKITTSIGIAKKGNLLLGSGEYDKTKQ